MKPITREEQYYAAMTNDTPDKLPKPITREEKYLKAIAESGGGGGTTNYNVLTNKPSINGIILEGNKTSKQLGLTSLVGVYNNEQLTLS